MSSSHKGSRLQLSGNPFVLDFPTAYFDYNNDTSGIQFGSLILPSGNPVATMRPMEGMFGGGIAIEEGTTNMASINDSNWNLNKSTGVSGSVVVTSSNYPQFTTSAMFTFSTIPSGGWQVAQYSHGISSWVTGNTYTWSIYCKKLTSDNIYIKLADANGANTHGSQIIFSGNIGEWGRVQCTWQPTITSGGSQFYITASQTAKFEVANPQIEQKAFATSFVNGTRALGSLNYPPMQITNNFTVSAWVNCSEPTSDFVTYHKNALCYFTDPSGTDTIEFFPRGNQTTPKIAFWSTSTWYYGNAILQPNTWYHVAWTYDGSNINIYVNGKLDSTIAVTHNYNKMMNFNVGGNSQETLNGMISDLIVNPFITMSAEDISAIYLSNRPTFNPYDRRAYAL
jgi:hypothetical protein